VLADRLALHHHFSHTTRSILSLQFRGPRVIAEIRNSNADVLCLQEVDRVTDFYEPMLNALGYSLVHYGRPGLFRGEGIALAYKPETFKILEKETIDFDDLKNIYQNGSVFSNGNQALLCLFQHRESGRCFIGGSAHLHFNPKLDFIKHAQAIYLLERSAAFLRKHSNLNTLKLHEQVLPFFLGGDFNSTPISSVMSVIHHEEIDHSDKVLAGMHAPTW